MDADTARRGTETPTDVATISSMDDMPDLLIADRCDQCQSQAFVSVRLSTGILLFCGHHFARNEAGLLAKGAHVRDQRNLINATSASSA